MKKRASPSAIDVDRRLARRLNPANHGGGDRRLHASKATVVRRQSRWVTQKLSTTVPVAMGTQPNHLLRVGTARQHLLPVASPNTSRHVNTATRRPVRLLVALQALGVTMRTTASMQAATMTTVSMPAATATLQTVARSRVD